MASRSKIELDSAGVRALLQSPEVLADMQRRAENIAAAAGDGVEATSWIGFDRAHGRAATVTHEADLAEAQDRVLTRAIEAGRR